MRMAYRIESTEVLIGHSDTFSRIGFIGHSIILTPLILVKYSGFSSISEA